MISLDNTCLPAGKGQHGYNQLYLMSPLGPCVTNYYRHAFKYGREWRALSSTGLIVSTIDKLYVKNLPITLNGVPTQTFVSPMRMKLKYHGGKLFTYSQFTYSDDKASISDDGGIVFDDIQFQDLDIGGFSTHNVWSVFCYQNSIFMALDTGSIAWSSDGGSTWRFKSTDNNNGSSFTAIVGLSNDFSSLFVIDQDRKVKKFDIATKTLNPAVIKDLSVVFDQVVLTGQVLRNNRIFIKGRSIGNNNVVYITDDEFANGTALTERDLVHPFYETFMDILVNDSAIGDSFPVIELRDQGHLIQFDYLNSGYIESFDNGEKWIIHNNFLAESINPDAVTISVDPLTEEICVGCGTGFRFL